MATRRRASRAAAKPTGQAGSIYSKLIRKGMSPKQARAFAAQAAKRSRGK